MISPELIYKDLSALRKQKPIVHNITNYVAMHWTANCLLALGASPIMAHAVEEVEEIVDIANSLVMNIGTLSAPWLQAMDLALTRAGIKGIPVVFDPVGAGATQMRRNYAQSFLESQTNSIIKGNASEILALADARSQSKGVDSIHHSELALENAQKLSQKHSCVIAISGPVDCIVFQKNLVRIYNGSPLMTYVTAMGCAASAIVGAFAAVQSSSFLATVSGMAVSGLCGEIAAENCKGPGSFQGYFLDALYNLDEATLKNRLCMESLDATKS